MAYARPWTDADKARLRELVPVMLQTDIAREMGFCVNSVNRMVGKLGLRDIAQKGRPHLVKVTPPRVFTPEEQDYIRAGLGTLSQTQMRIHLKCAPESLLAYIRANIDPHWRFLNSRDVASNERKRAEVYIAANWRSQTDEQMAKALGRSPYGIGKIRAALGYKRIGTIHRNNQERQTLNGASVDMRAFNVYTRAQTFLQKWGPVYRCDDNGRLNSNGGKWRYFTGAILTDEQLLAKAEYKLRQTGVDPDAWRRLAA